MSTLTLSTSTWPGCFSWYWPGFTSWYCPGFCSWYWPGLTSLYWPGLTSWNWPDRMTSDSEAMLWSATPEDAIFLGRLSGTLAGYMLLSVIPSSSSTSTASIHSVVVNEVVSVVVGSDAGVTVDIMLPSLSSKVVVSMISGSAVMEPAAASGVRGAERGCSARSGYIILVVLASTRSVVSSFVSRGLGDFWLGCY